MRILVYAAGLVDEHYHCQKLGCKSFLNPFCGTIPNRDPWAEIKAFNESENAVIVSYGAFNSALRYLECDLVTLTPLAAKHYTDEMKNAVLFMTQYVAPESEREALAKLYDMLPGPVSKTVA